MVERVASKMDFAQPRVIAEYGPGEGVHSREIARRMTSDSHLLLFELDAALARALERQFAGDRRVHVIHVTLGLESFGCSIGAGSGLNRRVKCDAIEQFRGV